MVRHIGRDSSANYGPSRRDSDTNDSITTEGADAGAAKRSGGRAKGNGSAKKVVFRPSVRPLPLGPTAKAGTPPPPLPSAAAAATAAAASLVDNASNRSRSSTAGPVGRLVSGRRNNALLNGGSAETSLRKAVAAAPASNKEIDAKLENPWVMRARRSTAPPAPAISNVSVEDPPTAKTDSDDSNSSSSSCCGGGGKKMVALEERQQDETLDSAVDFSDDAAEKTIGNPVVVEIAVPPSSPPPPPQQIPSPLLSTSPLLPPLMTSDVQRPSSVESTTYKSEPKASVKQPLWIATTALPATTPAIGIWGKPAKNVCDVSGHSDAEAAPVSDSAKWWKARLSGTSRAVSSEPETLKSASSSRRQSLASKGLSSQSAASLPKATDNGAKTQRGSRRHQPPVPTVVPPLILARATPTIASTTPPAATASAATAIATAASFNPPEYKPTSEPPVNEPVPDSLPIVEPVKDNMPTAVATENPVQMTDQPAKKRTVSSNTKYVDNWRSKPESKPAVVADLDKLKQRKSQLFQNQVLGVSSSSLSSDSAVESKPRLPSVRRRSSAATKNSTGSTTKPVTVATSWRSDPSRARRSQSVVAPVGSSVPKQPPPARPLIAGDKAIVLGTHSDQFTNLLQNIPPTTSMPQYRSIHASLVVPSSASSASSSPQVHGVATSLSSNHPDSKVGSNTRSQPPLLPHTMLSDILDSSGGKSQYNASSSTSLFNPTANPLLSPPELTVAPSARGNYPRYSETPGSGIIVTNAQLGSNLYALSSGVNPLWIDPSSVGGSDQTPRSAQQPSDSYSLSQGDSGYKGPVRVPPQPIGTRGTRNQRTPNTPQNHQQQQQQQQQYQQQQQQWMPYQPTSLELSGQYNAPLTSNDMQTNYISQANQAQQYLVPPPPQSMMMIPAMHVPRGIHAPEGYPSVEPNTSSINSNNSNNNSNGITPPFMGMVPAQHLVGSMHNSPPVVYPAYGYSGVLGHDVQPPPYVSYPQPHHFSAPHMDYMNMQMVPPGYGRDNNPPQFYYPGHGDVELAQAAEQSLHIGQTPQMPVGVGNIASNGCHHPGMHSNARYGEFPPHPEQNDYRHATNNDRSGAKGGQKTPTGKGLHRTAANISTEK
ncbi:hypothetical protein IW138_006220 [Coemansia sp. RSA 986]|nr:hypothetical protein IW138_006220 [Coemansia sp. RSA 986]